MRRWLRNAGGRTSKRSLERHFNALWNGGFRNIFDLHEYLSFARMRELHIYPENDQSALMYARDKAVKDVPRV